MWRKEDRRLVGCSERGSWGSWGGSRSTSLAWRSAISEAVLVNVNKCVGAVENDKKQ